MNILIVEDMPELKLRNYEALLYQLKIQYKVVGSREAAISYLENLDDSQEFEIDGMILDLDFPGFENGKCYDQKMGLDIIEYLRKNGSNIPVMINSNIKLKQYEMEYSYMFGQCESAYDPNYWEKFFEYIYSLE